MTNAVLWQWAKDQGLTPSDIAEAMGYDSPDYVEQVLRGWTPMTDKFVGRFFQTYPQYAFILLSVSEKTDTMPETAAIA